MGQAGVIQMLSIGPSCEGATQGDNSQFLSRAGCVGSTLSKKDCAREM